MITAMISFNTGARFVNMWKRYGFFASPGQPDGKSSRWQRYRLCKSSPALAQKSQQSLFDAERDNALVAIGMIPTTSARTVSVVSSSMFVPADDAMPLA